MRDFRRSWGVGLALTLFVCALARPALAGWPNAIPAQPLVQAPRVCALGITNLILNRRCRVETFVKLGRYQDHDWYYAFYGVRWADRHGTIERGYPIVFYLQKPATLRLGLWVNDEPGLAGAWARTPAARPVLVERPDGTYLGMTLKAVRGQDDQRLFRLKPDNHWTTISVLYRSDEDNLVLNGAIPKRCVAVDEGAYDWATFRFNLVLKEKSGGDPCGVVSTAPADKANSTAPSLTSKAAATISPSR